MMFWSVAGKKTGQRQQGKNVVSCRRSVLINEEKMSSFLYQLCCFRVESSAENQTFYIAKKRENGRELIALYLETIFVKDIFLFRPQLWGEQLYTQMDFFCSVNFGRSIFSSQRNVSGTIKKLVQLRFQNKKIFLIFVFFSSSYRG